MIKTNITPVVERWYIYCSTVFNFEIQLCGACTLLAILLYTLYYLSERII